MLVLAPGVRQAGLVDDVDGAPVGMPSMFMDCFFAPAGG